MDRMDRMDRKFNDFKQPNRGDTRRGYSRPGDIDREKFRRTIEDGRRQFLNNSDDFRSHFRGNLGDFRRNLDKDKAEEKARERGAAASREAMPPRDAGDSRGDADRDNFTEDFHERQVDYHKNFRQKKDDGYEPCDGDA